MKSFTPVWWGLVNGLCNEISQGWRDCFEKWFRVDIKVKQPNVSWKTNAWPSWSTNPNPESIKCYVSIRPTFLCWPLITITLNSPSSLLDFNRVWVKLSGAKNKGPFASRRLINPYPTAIIKRGFFNYHDLIMNAASSCYLIKFFMSTP